MQKTEKQTYCIYFVAVGDAALTCLEMAYCSLRAQSEDIDVYILTDSQELPFHTGNHTHIRHISNHDLQTDPLSDSPIATFDSRSFNLKKINKKHLISKWAIANTRTLVASYLPLHEYSHVLYLDCDIITQGPLETLHNFLKKNSNSIITSRNRTRILGGLKNFSLLPPGRKQTATASNLTFTELLRYWYTQPVCSDVVCFPTNNFGQTFMNHWKQECKKYIYQDQSALQAVLLRHFKSRHVLAPYTLFGHGPSELDFAKNNTVEHVPSVFVHFHGALKEPSAMKKYYSEFIEK